MDNIKNTLILIDIIILKIKSLKTFTCLFVFSSFIFIYFFFFEDSIKYYHCHYTLYMQKYKLYYNV